MDKAVDRISRLICRHVNNKLTTAQAAELESWKQEAVQNRLLADSFLDESLRNQKLQQYKLTDATSLWSNMRWRASHESGFVLEEKPEIPIPITGIRKIILTVMIVLGILCVTAVIYMTISNLRNHRFPLKSLQQRSFRL